jgi:hypothetical protein
LDAVDYGLLDDVGFFVVVVVFVIVDCGFGVELASSGFRSGVERRRARRSRVAVSFAHVYGLLAALWACVEDGVFGNALHF